MPRALRNVFRLRRAGVFSFQVSTPFQGWLGEAWTNNMHVTSNVIFRKHTFNPRLLDHQITVAEKLKVTGRDNTS